MPPGSTWVGSATDPAFNKNVSKCSPNTPKFAIRLTSPVGVPMPPFGATAMLAKADCPCTILVGARPSVVVVDLNVTELQLLTRFETFTEPKPVAKS